MREESVTKHLKAAINEGRHDGGSFFGSILAGTLLGLGLDWWLGTAPLIVVIGVVLGAYAGFARLWQEIKSQPDPPAVTLPRVGLADGEADS
jgi:F0F1-type ATP synthase assembly protein I